MSTVASLSTQWRARAGTPRAHAAEGAALAYEEAADELDAALRLRGGRRPANSRRGVQSRAASLPTTLAAKSKGANSERRVERKRRGFGGQVCLVRLAPCRAPPLLGTLTATQSRELCHHTPQRGRLMRGSHKKKKRKRGLYHAGEKGTNRVRLYHPRNGTLMLEYFGNDGRRRNLSLRHTDVDRGKGAADDLAGSLRRAEVPSGDLTLRALLGKSMTRK